MKLSFSKTGIQDYLNGMLDRTRLVTGWLNRVAYPMIIKDQRLRWQTEGSSEGASWEPLNPRYARVKLKRFAAYPGAGRKMLVATSRLVSGMTGDNTSDHYKLVQDTRIYVGTTIAYAKFVDEKRDITQLSDSSVDEIVSGLADYLVGG